MEACRQSRTFVQCESKKSSGSPTVEPWCSGDAKLQIAHLAAATCQYVPDPQNATKGLEPLDVLRSGQIPLATLTLKTLLYLSSWSHEPAYSHARSRDPNHQQEEHNQNWQEQLEPLHYNSAVLQNSSGRGTCETPVSAGFILCRYEMV